MLRFASLAALAGIVVSSSAALADDIEWSSLPYTLHSSYQAVTPTGAPAYGGAFPIRLIGVVINNTEDWLDPTAAYDPAVHLNQMGGQAELIIQAVASEEYGTTGDFGGTFCWMGQNLGNHFLHQDVIWNYTNAQWTAELGRLNLFGGDGLTEPIRAGDLVEVRARIGLHYKGKFNVNEGHDSDYDRLDDWDGLGSPGDGKNHDFEIVVIQRDYGMPEPAQLTLADFKDEGNGFIFDSTGQAGGEKYQASWVELKDVWIASAADWTGNSQITVTDGARTLGVYLGLNPSFNGTALFAPGEHFNVKGIVSQSSASGMDGYQLLALSAENFSPAPEPASLALLALGSLTLLQRRTRDGKNRDASSSFADPLIK